MCELLSVPRSSFYAWSTRPVSQRDQRKALVGQAVEAAYIQFKKRYGAPRLAEELNDSGIGCSVNHVAQLLSELGLRARNGVSIPHNSLTGTPAYTSTFFRNPMICDSVSRFFMSTFYSESGLY